MLCQIRGDRRGIDPTLGIEHILAPGLVEADGYVVVMTGHRLATGPAEQPGAQESWRTRLANRVIIERRRKTAFIPATRIQMDVVAFACEPANEVRDVGL